MCVEEGGVGAAMYIIVHQQHTSHDFKTTEIRLKNFYIRDLLKAS